MWNRKHGSDDESRNTCQRTLTNGHSIKINPHALVLESLLRDDFVCLFPLGFRTAYFSPYSLSVCSSGCPSIYVRFWSFWTLCALLLLEKPSLQFINIRSVSVLQLPVRSTVCPSLLLSACLCISHWLLSAFLSVLFCKSICSNEATAVGTRDCTVVGPALCNS